MKKIFLSVIVAGMVLSTSAQQKKAIVSQELQQVEQRFRTASQKRDLASDAAFTGKLKDILAKGNASSAQLIADHCDFLLLCDMGDAVKASMGKMPATVKNSATGLRMQDAYYSQCPAPAVGSYALDFTLPTPDGKTIHFYDFIKDKKCVLLDFWASWCVWCRKENPTVKAVYDKYRDQGFTVLSVSLDDKEPAWRKALAEDAPTWPQAWEKRGTKAGLYAWYGLNGIPAIFLIGPDGKIMATGLRGNKIEEAVKENL